MKHQYQEQIAQIKEKLDISVLVGEHVRLKRIGRDYSGLCPFHTEKTPSFTVSPSKGFYHCFGCGKHGDQIDWMVEYLGMAWSEAVARLAEMAGISLPENEDSTRITAKRRVSAVLEKAARWMNERLKENGVAMKYILEERKVSSVSINDFLVGFAPRDLREYANFFDTEEIGMLMQAGLLARSSQGSKIYPKMGGRIIFPIRDVAGWIVGFSGRALGDEQPKYVNSNDSAFFSKRHELFRPPNLQRAIRRSGRVLVTEGYFDTIALYAAGFDYTVATMGTATTAENIKSIFSISPEVVFCFDGDNAGLRAAWNALIVSLPFIGDGINGFRMASFIFLPAGDPDEYIVKHGREAFSALIDNAVPLSVFFLDSYTKKKLREPLEKHGAIMSQAAKQISTIKDEMLRNSLATEIAKVFGVGVEKVRSAGGFSVMAQQKKLPWKSNPGIQEGELEKHFLVNIIRRPWEITHLAEDVELDIPGGTEIVQLLRKSHITPDDHDAVRRIFSETPYWAFVEKLMSNQDPDDDIAIMALRVEITWIARKVESLLKAEDADRDVLRQFLSRKLSVQVKLEELLSFGQRKTPITVS
jgi:DNA primase